MPEKIFNPFTDQEIRALYESGFSTAIIAEYEKLMGITVNKTTVLRWVKHARCETKRHSPCSANSISCPFSPERLNDIYWRDQKSVSEIGELARDIIEAKKPICQATVTRWLRAAGVTLRTAAQSQRVRVIHHPEDFQGYIVHALIKLTPELLRKNNGISPEIRVMGVKAAAEIKRLIRETRVCALPCCGKSITRRPCDFRHCADRTFCSKSHANRHRFQKGNT